MPPTPFECYECSLPVYSDAHTCPTCPTCQKTLNQADQADAVAFFDGLCEDCFLAREAALEADTAPHVKVSCPTAESIDLLVKSITRDYGRRVGVV